MKHADVLERLRQNPEYIAAEYEADEARLRAALAMHYIFSGEHDDKTAAQIRGAIKHAVKKYLIIEAILEEYSDVWQALADYDTRGIERATFDSSGTGAPLPDRGYTVS